MSWDEFCASKPTHSIALDGYVNVGPKDKSTNIYTIGKISPFVDFDISMILNTLNKEEFGDVVPADCWGGSAMIGGSPRVSGSKLSPKMVEEIINKTIALKQ